MTNRMLSLWTVALPCMAVGFIVAFNTESCRAETASWNAPDLDTWVYPNVAYQPDFNITPGNRAFGPSFGGLSYDEPTEALIPGFDSRTGYSVFAFETLDKITPGLDPSRYQVNSVSFTVTAERGQGGDLVYSETPLTIESVTNAVRDGQFGTQVPVELFGVGFNETFDFRRFDLGVVDGVPAQDLYSETEDVWGRTSADREYILYPVDAQGRDSVNSLNGGFSASEASAETDPFTHEPFAIGTVAGAVEGQTLPMNTTFSFDLDLSNPGIADYIKNGLSQGVVGFTMSTLHGASMPGGQGGDPFPQWYMKDAAATFPNTVPASLAIDYTILPLLGDYNGDGEVTEADYFVWAASYGDTVNPGEAADGSGDGVIDAADFTVWRDAFTGTAAVAVPEPSAAACAFAGLATFAFCVGVRVCTSPKE